MDGQDPVPEAGRGGFPGNKRSRDLFPGSDQGNLGRHGREAGPGKESFQRPGQLLDGHQVSCPPLRRILPPIHCPATAQRVNSGMNHRLR